MLLSIDAKVGRDVIALQRNNHSRKLLHFSSHETVSAGSCQSAVVSYILINNKYNYTL